MNLKQLNVESFHTHLEPTSCEVQLQLGKKYKKYVK